MATQVRGLLKLVGSLFFSTYWLSCSYALTKSPRYTNLALMDILSLHTAAFMAAIKLAFAKLAAKRFWFARFAMFAVCAGGKS